MKRLILMRHAKSSWDNLRLTDHDRTLNERGRTDCPMMAAWLVAKGYTPTEVICSTASRCMETWEAVGMAAQFDPPVRYEKSLYHATAERLMTQLQKGTTDTVMLLAHNPGIGDFAARLVKLAPNHPKFMYYPTAAITVIDFDTPDWASVGFGTGTAVDFVTPRDLRT
ncbi:hypothetical protein BFP76_01315 [Amylibacter kogurei]|uniref:Phosphoglycerate mutase n=1 Tax=Paramylibacter kogurei TaxID=1889778 RepID=A0A2G5K4I8_9RHOB|nr:histidine phosphatase family protein [Amylibacter kogurei]PIB23923.1 hypothetical protein BFP76_01315 [Amylibacter kogurei]